ncbi:hypothetical protein niasHT_019971 [Heterodera trifolii]|uniref:Uncharacterized protein n=1 Tax=Heterodera trifolii TaxID=157864 RepID=A0ABD2LGV9_9BILA
MSGTNSSAGGAGTAKRRPSVEFLHTGSSVPLWSRNPLANLFRRSKRKEEKHRRIGTSEHEEEGEDGAKQHNGKDGASSSNNTKMVDKARKRSSSCDAMTRFGTRFDEATTADDAEIGGTTLRRGDGTRSTRRRKRSGDRLHHHRHEQRQQQQQQPYCSHSTDPVAHSSSFSSLLHHRIFLSSRGASPLVPFFQQKNAKGKYSPANFVGKNIEANGKQCKATRSHQNISRLIREETNYRRDHSLDSAKVPSCLIREVPIVRVPYPSFGSSSATIGGCRAFPSALEIGDYPPQRRQHLYERREEFFHRTAQCQQNGSSTKLSWEQRTAELEEWMQTQPISLRKLEQHERMRLMVAGGI